MKFLLTCSDAWDEEDRKVDAALVAQARLRAGVWPLYQKTKNLHKVSSGAECIFYIAGTRAYRGHFLGKGRVEKVAEFSLGNWYEPFERALTEPPAKIIQLGEVQFWMPLNIRPLLKELGFIKEKRFWGIHMQGGCRALDGRDFQMIVDQSVPASGLILGI